MSNRRPTTLLPPIESPLVIDSKYRKVTIGSADGGDGPDESPYSLRNTPYNFQIDLSAPLNDVAQVEYTGLFWNQPLYTHNLTNCELIFRVRDPTTGGISQLGDRVAYAMPFVGYTSYSGLSPQNHYGTPPANSNSYCTMMEVALNADSRAYNTNLYTSGAELYRYGNVFISTNKVNMKFRYSPTRGFAIWAEYDDAGLRSTNTLEIELFPCSYIEKGHNIHGFGFPYDGDGVYKPKSGYQAIYYAEGTPNLLPSRFVIVSCPELTSFRTIRPIATSDNKAITNEIAILPLQKANSGIYHSNNVVSSGFDSVISMFSQYQMPQSITLTMSDDTGKRLIASNVLQRFLHDNDTDVTSKNAFLTNGGGPLRISGLGLSQLLYGDASITSEFPETTYTPLPGANGDVSSYPWGRPDASGTTDDVIHKMILRPAS